MMPENAKSQKCFQLSLELSIDVDLSEIIWQAHVKQQHKKLLTQRMEQGVLSEAGVDGADCRQIELN